MYKIIAVFIITVFGLGYIPPPPAPSDCSDKYCVELYPAESFDKGFVVPEVRNYNFDNKSILIANYIDVGTITIIGPFHVYKKEPHYKVERINETLITTNCNYAMPNDNSREVCSQYIIMTSQFSGTSKPLLCLIASLWEKNEESVANLATIRIDLNQNINSYCLNKRSKNN